MTAEAHLFHISLLPSSNPLGLSSGQKTDIKNAIVKAAVGGIIKNAAEKGIAKKITAPKNDGLLNNIAFPRKMIPVF